MPKPTLRRFKARLKKTPGIRTVYENIDKSYKVHLAKVKRREKLMKTIAKLKRYEKRPLLFKEQFEADFQKELHEVINETIQAIGNARKLMIGSAGATTAGIWSAPLVTPIFESVSLISPTLASVGVLGWFGGGIGGFGGGATAFAESINYSNRLHEDLAKMLKYSKNAEIKNMLKKYDYVYVSGNSLKGLNESQFKKFKSGYKELMPTK